MERPENNKKPQDALGDEGDSPDLLGRNIAQMRVEDAWPDIKERSKTKKNERTGTDPARDMVNGNPAHMMIPGGDITSRLSITARFEHSCADGPFAIGQILRVVLVSASQPSGFVHEFRHVNFLDIASKIVGGFCGHEDFTVPFPREGRKGALDRKREMEKLTLAKNQERE